MTVAESLTLSLVFQLIRYELGLSKDQAAAMAGFTVPAYDAIERRQDRLTTDDCERLLNQVPALLPTVLSLVPERELQAIVGRIHDRLEALIGLPANRQSVELARIRLELSWRDGRR